MSQKTNGDDLTMTFGVSAITKREYFAALALQGLLANPACMDYATLVDSSVEYADKLIAAMNKPQAQESEVQNG